MPGDTPKAVRRTLIVSAGFPGGAGDFCKAKIIPYKFGRPLVGRICKTS